MPYLVVVPEQEREVPIIPLRGKTAMDFVIFSQEQLLGIRSYFHSC